MSARPSISELPSRGVDVFGPNVSPILYHLNEEQKKKYLLPTIRGERMECFALTEPVHEQASV